MAMSLRTLGHQGPLLDTWCVSGWWLSVAQRVVTGSLQFILPFDVSSWGGGAGESLGGEEHGFPSQTPGCESCPLSADCPWSAP